MTVDDSKLPIKTRDAEAVLDCAQLFEFNVTEDEWMDLWMKCDPAQSKRMAGHMWGKFRGSDPQELSLGRPSLLNTLGHADLKHSRILARMVVLRCQEHDPHVFRRMEAEKPRKKDEMEARAERIEKENRRFPYPKN